LAAVCFFVIPVFVELRDFAEKTEKCELTGANERFSRNCEKDMLL
jgi:hypothetical protein